LEAIVLWTRKAGLLATLGICSLFFGLIVADFQFVILALFIFTLLLLIVTLPKPTVNLEREVTNALMFENNDLKVKLKLKKVTDGYGTIEVFDRIPEYADLRHGLNTMMYNFEGQRTMKYTLHFPLRGYYSVGPSMVRVSDHFNLFYKEHEATEKLPLSVFPRVPGLKDFRLKNKRYIHFPGEFLTRQPGSSTEFYSIRDYIKGDPFKKINWKVYARKRDLMVNEYEKENICDTVMFLDSRRISNTGTIIDNALETGVKLALGITNFLILHRNQIGLVVYSDQVRVLPPKLGIRHRDDITRFLTGIYANGATEFNIAMYYAKPYIKSKTTIIIISNLDYDRSIIPTIQQLVALNHRIMIITPSSLDFEVKASGYTGPDEKISLIKLTRDNYLTHLRGLGVDIIECLPEDSIDHIVNKVSRELMR
jgi:uncharacterized protein (DUF58 family)